MINIFTKKYRFFLIITTIFIILRLPSLFEPYWYGDEGIYLVLGQAIRNGQVLYQQIHDNKPPTLYYLAALSQTVFGFRLLLSIFMAGSIYYFNKLSLKLFSKKSAQISTILFTIITSIPVIEGHIANAEVFMLLPTLMGIYLFLFGNHKNKFLSVGLLLGFAFTIKVPVFVEFALLCAWIFIFNFSLSKIKYLSTSLLSLLIGFGMPIFLYYSYFVYRGAANDFVFAAILQNFGYLSSWSTGTHTAGAANSGLAIRGVLMLVGWVLLYFAYIRKIISQNILFVLSWFVAALFGVLLSTRPYPHYLIQIIPSLVLIIVYTFSSITTIKQRLIMVSLVLCLAYSISHYKFYFYPVFSYYNNFYTHIFKLGSKEYRNYFGNRVDDTYQISKFISEHSTPSEKIYVWGDEPYIYALSNRLPVGRFTVAYHVADFNQYQYTYDQLKIAFPKIIVYYPQEGRPFPDLVSFIKLYYSPAQAVGEATIYTRND